VKAFILCLGLIALSAGGCLPVVNREQQPGNVKRPPEVEIAEPPPPVKPEEVNEGNARDVLRRLEVEIKYDEGPAAPKRERD